MSTPQIIGTVLIFAIPFIALVRLREDFLHPEAETRRPAPVDPCDFTEALKPLGGLPSWESTRRES